MEACVATNSDLTAARALFDAGRLDEAAASCRAMLARDVDDQGAMHLLAVVLMRAGNAAEAVPLLAHVAAQDPNAGVLWALLGEALQTVGLTDEAIARWRLAVSLRPDMPEPWLALGNALSDRDELAEAEHCFRSAIAAKPDFVEGLHNLGNALVAQHRLEEAAHCFTTALTLGQNSANTGFAHALGLLLGGDFAAGWRHFEARREATPLRWNYQRRPDLPQWQLGQTLAGRRVLVMAEQGWGDVIQFVRYVPMLAEHGATVVLELPRDLHGIFATLPGAARIVALEDPVADCELACPLLSLPLYFATMPDSVPATVPYATVPAAQLERWRTWLGPAQRRRIGLVCSGRPDHPLDRNRSLPLARLAPILAAPDCDFVLVQQQLRERDQAALLATPALRWAGPDLHDFGDTAALLSQLDLLISVDTSVAHLAGALAMPVWVMLPFAPDFRWMLGRSDSPWYPTMRLYRQPARGGWDAVLAAVRRELDALR